MIEGNHALCLLRKLLLCGMVVWLVSDLILMLLGSIAASRIYLHLKILMCLMVKFRNKRAHYLLRSSKHMIGKTYK